MKSNFFARFGRGVSLFVALLFVVELFGIAPISLNQVGASPVTIFSDSFENTPQFTNPVWDGADPQWQASSQQACDGTRKARVEGNTNIPAHSSDDVLSKSVSTVGYQNIAIGFCYRTGGGLEQNDGDNVYIEWTTDGTNWTQAHVINYLNEAADWTQVAVALPSSTENNSNFAFRFRAHLDAGNDKVFIDSVIVNGNSLPGNITVTKVVNGGEAQISDFPLFVGDTAVVSGESNAFSPGSYSVTETNITGYVPTFSGDCDAQGNISLASGDNKICTITNSWESAPEILLTKEAVFDPDHHAILFTINWKVVGTSTNNLKIIDFAPDWTDFGVSMVNPTPTSVVPGNYDPNNPDVEREIIWELGPKNDGDSGSVSFKVEVHENICKIENDANAIADFGGETFQVTSNKTSTTVDPEVCEEESLVPLEIKLFINIKKYLDGAPATVESANGYGFPIYVGASGANGSWIGNLLLAGSSYEVTSPEMTAPVSLSFYEVDNFIDPQSLVLPIGAECKAGMYRLLGYRVAEDGYEKAENATLRPNSLNSPGISDDRFIIVENETCPDPQIKLKKTGEFQNEGRKIEYTISWEVLGSAVDSLTITDEVPDWTDLMAKTVSPTSTPPIATGQYNFDPNNPDASRLITWDLGPQVASSTGTVSFAVEVWDGKACRIPNIARALGTWGQNGSLSAADDLALTSEENCDDDIEEPVDPEEPPCTHDCGGGGGDILGADVALTKSVDDSEVTIGQTSLFVLHVTNNGPDTATNVVVTDAMPAGLTFVSASTSVGTYDSSVNEWTIASLALNETVTLELYAIIAGTEGQTIVNTAVVDIDPNIEINTTNNTASASVTIVPEDTGGIGPTGGEEEPTDDGDGGSSAASSNVGGGGGSGGSSILSSSGNPGGPSGANNFSAPSSPLALGGGSGGVPEGEVLGEFIGLPDTGAASDDVFHRSTPKDAWFVFYGALISLLFLNLYPVQARRSRKIK